MTYNESVQDSQLNIVFNPPTSLGNTFMMKVSSAYFVMSASNAQLVMYPVSVYMQNQKATTVLKVCAGFALFLMVIGLAFRGLIGIELLNTMQMAYFSVSLLSNVPATMTPFAQLSELVNGFVFRWGEAIDTYSPLLQMNVSAQFLSNCNIMLVLELLVVAVGFGLGLLKKSASDENKRSLLNRISMFLMKDILLLLALFNALNLSFSCGVYLRDVQSADQSMEVSVFNGLGIAVGLIIEAAIIYCIFKDFKYADCEIVLKDGTAERYRLAIYHPGFLCIHRMLMGTLMGMLFDVKHRVFAILVLQLAYTVFCFVKNPFKTIYMIVRQLICELTILFAIVVSIVYEYAESQMYTTAWMWTEVGMLIACVIVSYGCMVKMLWSHIFDNNKKTYPKG
jgi:hypothetical protein